MPDPRDPRVTQPTGPTLPGEGFVRPTPLTPEQQENQVRLLMNDIFRAALPESDPIHINMLPADLDRYNELLDAWAFYTPDLVTRVAEELRGEFGFDPAAPGDVPGDALLAEIFNQILSTAEQRSEVVRVTTEGQTTVTREGTTVRERDTTITTTRFVDLPTPEEFMNDFTTGLAAYVGDLRGQGLITRDAAAFMLDNPDIFYARYLSDLSDRIDAGEDIFQVVGADGTPVRIGEREAGTEEIETTGIDRERVLQEVLSNERTQIEEEVIRELTSTGTVETTEQQQQVDAEIDRRVEERTNTLINEAIQFFGTENTISIEQIFSRPRLTSVFKISPRSFLTSTISASEAENFAAGQRGTEQARRETAEGINVSAPRRVGGR